MAKSLIVPRVHVMVLCDAIKPSQDEEGVCDLRGVRTQIVADSFPHTQSRIYVYAQLTGHPGEAAGEVSVLHAQNDQVVHTESVARIQFSGPLIMVPFGVRLHDCTFPEPGIYYIQLFIEGKLVCERFLKLSQA